MGHVLLPCNILLRTQLLYSLQFKFWSDMTNISTNSRFALTPISTLVHPVQVTGFTQLDSRNLYKWIHHSVHATLHTSTFPVYTLLTTSTLYWNLTNTSTTGTTWPSYSLLHYLLPFSTNHNRGFIHTSRNLATHHFGLNAPCLLRCVLRLGLCLHSGLEYVKVRSQAAPCSQPHSSWSSGVRTRLWQVCLLSKT